MSQRYGLGVFASCINIYGVEDDKMTNLDIKTTLPELSGLLSHNKHIKSDSHNLLGSITLWYYGRIAVYKKFYQLLSLA